MFPVRSHLRSTRPHGRAKLLAAFLLFIPAQRGFSQQRAQGVSLSRTDEVSLQHALEDYDAGRMDSAEPVLSRLALRYPNLYLVQEATGGLYAEAGNSERALPFLRRAAKLAPKEPVAHANLGAAYLKLDQPQAAVEELQAAVRLESSNVAAQSNLGRALMQLKRSREAADAFAAASRLQPGNVDAIYNYAVALHAAKQLQQAAETLDQVPATERNDAIESLRGEVAEESGDYKAAVLDFQAAAKLNPSAANLYTLELELLRHWTWDEALEIARFGQGRYPQDSRFRMTAGIALFGANKYPEAAVEYAALLAHDPNNALYADLLGRSCEAAGEQAGEACGSLIAFADGHPDNARAATAAAARILEQPLDHQDQPAAERLLRQAMAADPHLAEAYYQMGVLAQQKSEWHESQVALERAIELRPDYAEAHYRLSRAYAHLGQREQAQREIALQQQFSQQQKDQLNSRLQEVVLFLLKPS